MNPVSLLLDLKAFKSVLITFLRKFLLDWIYITENRKGFMDITRILKNLNKSFEVFLELEKYSNNIT